MSSGELLSAAWPEEAATHGCMFPLMYIRCKAWIFIDPRSALLQIYLLRASLLNYTLLLPLCLFSCCTWHSRGHDLNWPLRERINMRTVNAASVAANPHGMRLHMLGKKKKSSGKSSSWDHQTSHFWDCEWGHSHRRKRVQEPCISKLFLAFFVDIKQKYMLNRPKTLLITPAQLSRATCILSLLQESLLWALSSAIRLSCVASAPIQACRSWAEPFGVHWILWSAFVQA